MSTTNRVPGAHPSTFSGNNQQNSAAVPGGHLPPVPDQPESGAVRITPLPPSGSKKPLPGAIIEPYR